ncbi:hypothetical protein PR202_gn00409 [Eleusine coracana subsp. coracana]|uniref:Uncharacterized protein n=1 Tax=Eleusine coracana subsp. coracana TaxID=191504 RepID=A0AAV5FZH7_ELECO|nr:hypothetical protein PR202_gn00409 [Eleusine coracana subsp. coracana]
MCIPVLLLLGLKLASVIRRVYHLEAAAFLLGKENRKNSTRSGLVLHGQKEEELKWKWRSEAKLFQMYLILAGSLILAVSGNLAQERSRGKNLRKKISLKTVRATMSYPWR